MKTIRSIIALFAAALFLAACDSKTGLEFGIPGESGSSMSISSATIEAEQEVFVKSSDGYNLPVSVLEDEENGISISVSTTVSPILSDEPKTRVTEVTTSTLGSFVLNGYLGNGILDCRGASQADKDNRNFISNETVTKGGDGQWHFAGDYQWRSCVDHHFWAYSGTPQNLEIGGTNFNEAQFTYTTTGLEDLLVSYHEQEWIDENDGSGNWPIETMTFKHALSEIVLDFSGLIFKQVGVVGGGVSSYELCDQAQYTDESGVKRDIPEGMKPRLSITSVRMMTPGKGTCSATIENGNVKFDWTCSDADEDYLAINCIGVSDTSLFAIPQCPQNNIVEFTIYDKWRDMTTPFYIKLPALEGGAEWQPGYKYTYTLEGTLVAPYYTPIGKFDAKFVGKGFKTVAVMKNLQSKYVKQVRVTWKGLAVVNSNDTPEALIYTTGNHVPTLAEYPSEDYSDTERWADNPNVGFLTNCSHNVIAIPPRRGEIVGGNSASTYECVALFNIPPTFDPPITFYLIYNGDNGGNANWVLTDIQIVVTEFKKPMEIIP